MSDKFYTEENSDYLKNNPAWHSEDSAWKAGQIFKILEKNKIEFKNVLEIGCGAGEVLRQLDLLLKKEDAIYKGYDIAKDAIDIAKEKEKNNLKFYNEDLFTTSEKADLLLMIDVFEHVPDYLGFLKKAQKRADYFVFHIPLDISLQGILRNKLIRERESVGHLHYFTKETALATLKDAAYEIIDSYYTAATLDLPRKTWKSKLALWPRKILFKINKNFAVKLLGGFSLIVLAKKKDEV